MLEKIMNGVRKKAIPLALIGALSLGAVGTVQAQAKLQERFFACVDMKGTGKSLADYVGRKTTFKVKESLVLVDYAPSPLKVGDKEVFEIYGPKGDSLLKITQVPTKGEAPHITFGNEPGDTLGYTLTEFLCVLMEAGYGKYKAVWYLNDKKEGEAEFEIIK